MKNIAIVGATSAMAESCARIWAQRGCSLFLAGRDAVHLSSVAADLLTRGARSVRTGEFHADRLDDFEGFVAEIVKQMGHLDCVLIAHGSLTDQERAERDPSYMMNELKINGASTVALMSIFSRHLEARGAGSLGVISSVAGDRGRESNFAYGSAKSLVSAYASGLRQKLVKKGITITVVKPGFVSTPMTAHLPKGPLWANPADVAADIVRGIDRGAATVYTPWFWRPIMLVIRLIPNFVFDKMKL